MAPTLQFKLIFFNVFFNFANLQTLRDFPPLFNVAIQQPLRTLPSQSTCGIPSRSAFCRSGVSSSSVNTCVQQFCVQECPRRTSLPSFVNVLGSSSFPTCISKDYVNVRPGSNSTDFSAVFAQQQQCTFSTSQALVLGANGAVTLTFWIWRDNDNIGTIIEKFSATSGPVFRISCSSAAVRVLYSSLFGQRELVFSDVFPARVWTFIAIQVYDLSMSVFVNGTGLGFSARAVQGLIGQVTDTLGTVHLGQAQNGSNPFVGRLQDIRFFSETLTNREINEIYNGTLPAVRIASACRCPSSHPRVKPTDTRFCIRNGVPDNAGDDLLRLNNESRAIEYLNDGDSNSYWVSSFLSDVTIEVDLQDEFQVFYVVLQFYSPQPRIVTIERQTIDNPSWHLWQQYAYDCQDVGQPNNGPLTSPSSVNCLQFGTNGLLVPYSNGNITLNILSSEPVARPGHNDFYNTPSLIDFVKAKKIRVRLQGHYYVTHPLHNYYGIYEYIVTGRCDCHGHASTCDTSSRPYTCACRTDSNTMGLKCETCQPLFNAKPFRLGDQINPYNCKPCQCYGHAESCVYNATMDPFPLEYERGGGGICVNCQHNTQGRYCDECKDTYFRAVGKSLFAIDVCTSCDCLEAGVNDSALPCDKIGGQCSCKQYVTGRQCDVCEVGFFNLQSLNPNGCDSCNCVTTGTQSADVSCHSTTGQCSCKRNVQGVHCDSCQFGYFNLTTSDPNGCRACECNPFGATDQYCNPTTGQCLCKKHIDGRKCDRCQRGYTDFSLGCVPCGCDQRGTHEGTTCDPVAGQCTCKAHTTGLKCNQCLDGYYNMGGDDATGCLFCNCDPAGTLEGSQLCDKSTGECECKANVQERTCNQCAHNTYNLTASNPLGCTPCNCDPSGTLSGDQLPVAELACNHNSGQCTCLANRIGAKCERCALVTYINPVPGGGCLDCDCYQIGTIPSTHCDPYTGQCQCFRSGSGITGRRCDQCEAYYFNLHLAVVPRCDPCDCDPSGSLNDTCNAHTGQCECKLFTTGRQCGQCVPNSSDLQASNPFGCSADPSQQPPPSYSPVDPNTLRLFWSPPDYPNGIIHTYVVYRDGERVGQVVDAADQTELFYIDSGLSPFMDYDYQIEAINDYGSTRSPVVTYRTPSGRPSGDITLSVGTITPRTASFSWQPPEAANGIIQRYVLSSTNYRSADVVKHYEGLTVQVTVFELHAFTEYAFTLDACTSAGCLTSDPVTIVTRQAAPEGQQPPQIMALSSTQLYVIWEPPRYPNGIIIYYELWIRGIPGSGADGISRSPEEQRIFHPSGQYNPLPSAPPSDLPPPDTDVTLEELEPFTEYDFRVISENSFGKSGSSWVAGRTAEFFPQSVPTPTVEALTSSEVNMSWPEPTEKQARGIIREYRVYHYAPSNMEANPFAPPYRWLLVYSGDAMQRSVVVIQLHAFSNQTFRLELCNSIGCLNCSDVYVLTLLAAPGGVHPPQVMGYNDTTIEVSWRTPDYLNGPPPIYTIRRTAGAFNNPPPLVSRGTRFNGQGYYRFPEDTIPQGVTFTGIDLWFKTSQREGLIMFAASEGGQEEFVALQLRSGRPWFLFDPQACAVNLTISTSPDPNMTFADDRWHHVVIERVDSHVCLTVDDIYRGCAVIVTTTDDEGLPYNDNKWHHVHSTRQGSRGYLVMDQRWTGEKSTSCNTGNIIGNNTGVYVGGMPSDYIIQRTEADPRAQVIKNDFQGCLRDVRIMVSTSPEEIWRDLDWDSALLREGPLANWEGCPDDLEPAYHFLGTGYIIFGAGVFIGGATIDFSFEMRTEVQHGLLFFAHGGTNVYWLIQLLDGGIYVEFRADDWSQSLLFPNDTGVNLCDGLWHSVRVLQQGLIITTTVDNRYSRTIGSRNQQVLIFIASHMFIGGIPDEGEVNEFVQGHQLDDTIAGKFGGCIRNIRVNRRPYNVEENAEALVNVNMDGCPAENQAAVPCKVTLTHVIYEGIDSVVFDHGNLPFTEYLYQVEATNEAGSSFSSWAIGRTREGAPWGVHGPLEVEVIDGFTALITWQKPQGRTGILSGYVIRAYNIDRPQLEPVESEFNYTSRSGYLTGLRAFTNYSVHIVACTYGGCTESDDYANITTLEEAPDEVESPEANETTPFYIMLSWLSPGLPNGILTGYALYMDDSLIYSGSERSFNVTGLNVYTAYRFYLKTCSRVGCTNSSVAHYTTAQLPPTHVLPPRLTVLGTSRILVEWFHPDELNGALEEYRLYVSVVEGELGDIKYNSSDFFTSYTLGDLVAGTTHYVTVSACTGGGCRLSNASAATTAESAPDGVRVPEVRSPDPSRLNLTWLPPLYPNGVITLYRLYHNGLMAFNSTHVLHHTITSLQPWSLHSLRLEACTARGCSSSDTIQARTMEAPPVGTIGLLVRVEDPREILVQWNALEQPNGFVFYDVYLEGLFYVDPENWDYSTESLRQSLYHTANMSGDWISIGNLIPYSTYYVQINASNSQGFIHSVIRQAVMPMGSPDGVPAPRLTSPNSTAVLAVWEPVGRANADQEPAFQLQFLDSTGNGQVQNLLEQPTTANSYLKTGLDPFTEYEFRLVAINTYGETTSAWASITTNQDRPESLDPPMTSDVRERSISVTWLPPAQPNGVILRYVLNQNGTALQVFPSNTTQTRVASLIPYTVYVYAVEACTLAGCTRSADSTPVRTLPDVADGLSPPTLLSPTPTSVLVTWTLPQYPNGILLQYNLERRLKGMAAITLVQTFLPDDPRQYVDEDSLLTPYTVYEYRVAALSAQGSGYSNWSSVQTRSSRPGGVQPPTVESMASTTLYITWQEPIRLNGRLESYVLRLPNPRFEIYNVTLRSMLVEGLVPFTEYRVTITACTGQVRFGDHSAVQANSYSLFSRRKHCTGPYGGCTESLPTVVRTSPSLPSGVVAPVPTPHSQSYISILWQSPRQPNGPNIRYELARSKIQQPLIPDATGFGTWTSIYSGQDTYYEDRGLTNYTTYRYRVTAFNHFGHTRSEPSEEVTTFGGVPRRAAEVSAYTVNHTAIEIRWQTPDVFDLQGGVSEFVLNISSNASLIVTARLPRTAIDHVVSGLDPDTRYEALLTIVTHGGETVTSQPVYATTSDGVPEGLDPPQLFVINQTALNVAWWPPTQPNGRVTGYFLYVNGLRIDTRRTEAGSFILANLEPYTIYRIEIEVCTEYACLKSESTLGSTAESVAAGIRAPQAFNVTTSSITLQWSAPEEPNGIILRYELYRRKKGPCESDGPVLDEEGKCTYLECGILESFCGDQCYSGPRTCCDGVLHNNKNGYECCGKDYIPRRSNRTYVCCGGQFYNRLDNHQCCGGRYVEVRSGEVCCADANENRVDIGIGDRCCLSVPYASNGSQICCNGRLVQKHGNQCCGGQVLSDDMVCCGDDIKGNSFTSDGMKFCCATDYITSATTACCTDELGRAKPHVYESYESLQNSNEKCCGLERISNALDCCFGTGYNINTQTCSDVSQMESGCGSGVVCAIGARESTYCNRCNFDRNTHKCGSYHREVGNSAGDSLIIEEAGISNSESEDTLCLTEPLKIYTGDSFLFSDTVLSPYTEYQYTLSVVNGAGSASSDVTVVTTSQALPEGVQAPSARVEQDRLDTIFLDWEPPQRANGLILWYVLVRDGLEIFRHPNALTYTDDNVIQPYRTYTYLLKVCNSEGCVSSDEERVATLQGRPENVNPVSATPLSPFSLRLSWTEPVQPNGYIMRYMLYEEILLLVGNFSGEQHEFTVEGLEPYGLYEFTLSACTEVGCTNSSMVQARTLQERPDGVHNPELVILNSTAVEVFWGQPETPNGIITSSILYRARNQDRFQVIYEGDSESVYYLDSPVISGSTYRYLVQISTAAGATNSSSSLIQVPDVTPLDIPAPYNVTALSAYEIFVAWDPPMQTSGEIDQYKLLVNYGKPNGFSYGVFLATSEIVRGLSPYTLYEIRIQACLSGVNNGCGTGPGVSVWTMEAEPLNQPGPCLKATSHNAVEISWLPPLNRNGVITQYRIYRRLQGSSNRGLIVNSLPANVTSFINTGSDLRPFTIYEYSIVSVNSIGEAESPYVAVRTLEVPPEQMPPPEVVTVSAYSAIVRWQSPIAPNGVVLHYALEYQLLSDDTTSVSPIESLQIPAVQLQSSVSGLFPFSSYNIRVRAVNSAGSVTSTWLRFLTEQTSPAYLAPFEVEKNANGLSVILRWGEPGRLNGIINTYRIYEEGNVNAIYQGLNREFEYRRLQPYTEYTVQLEACTQAGCTLSPIQKFTTAEVPPESQPAPAIIITSSNEAHIQWRAPLNANGQLLYFEVLRRSEPRRAKGQLSEAVIVYRTENTSLEVYEFIDRNLEPFTSYEYRIRTANSEGVVESPWQRIDTPQAVPTGLYPPVVSHIDNFYDRLLIEWQDPVNANGIIQSYQLRRNNSVPWSFSVDDDMGYIDTGLTAFTVYSYTLTVCTSGGCTRSDPTVYRTIEAPPLFIAPPTLQTLNSTAILVSWTRPQITNGEIQEYVLKIDDLVVYTGLLLSCTAMHLVPYTAYTFAVSACTEGGCTDSEAVVGRPNEDIPQGMRAPVLRVTSSTSIEITWTHPEQPNGIITSYDLTRDGFLIQTTHRLVYVDYSVEPGMEYVYQVTAFNSRGNVTSPLVSARTFSSAPVGMSPPQLQPLYSSSIEATWEAPLRPNGLIYNYTLYQDSEIIFSANQFSYIVQNLQHYTQYSFRIEACTSNGCTISDIAYVRTLEAAPTDLAEPRLTALADSQGAHRGVLARWSPPLRPNGIIIRYELFRRESTGLSSDVYVGDRKLLYSGLELQFTDTGPVLLPYTSYEYMVAVYNAEGHVNSLWSSIQTLEAPPLDVPAPIVIYQDITPTTLPIEIEEPATPNGVVDNFKVYLNDSLILQGRRTYVVLGDESRGLEPLRIYTAYRIQIEACTSGGCTRSPSVHARTLPYVPRGLATPLIPEVGPRSMRVTWQAPAEPNGPDLTYELFIRRGCQFPYANEDDEVEIACSEDAWASAIQSHGDVFQKYIADLIPYTKYDVRLRVWNSGVTQYADSLATARTHAAAPEYIMASPPTIVPSGNALILDWTSSFHINAEVEEFVLQADNTPVYRGKRTRHTFYRESAHATYEFVVRLETEFGTAVSDLFVFNPTQIDGYISTAAPFSNQRSRDETPVYEEVWFIVIIVLLVLAIILVALVCAFRCGRRKRSGTSSNAYVRERPPLESQLGGKRTSVPLGLCVDPYDGSIITAELPKGSSVSRHQKGGFVAPGYVNPAMSSPLSVQTSPHSDLMSRKWDEDDFDSLLEGYIPNDSGLHSLAYGEDELDIDSDRPVNVLKEHIMFPDTHL